MDQLLRRGTSLWHSFIDFVAPRTCPSCSAPVIGAALCGACWSQARFVAEPLCHRCGLPFDFDPGDGSWCGRCIATTPLYDRARAAMIYDEQSRNLVLALKHGDRHDLVPLLVPLLRTAGGSLVDQADLVAAVPLHPRRLLERRFNQSALLAAALARTCERPFSPRLLRRTRNTPSQGGLGAAARRRNLQRAIVIPDRMTPVVRQRRVLLVDNVMTTGATAEACTKALLRAGAAAVDVLTVARVA